MNKLFLSLLICIVAQQAATAEVVTNSKGQKIKLNANNTWQFVKSTSADTDELIADKKIFTLQVKDGRGNSIDVKTSVEPNDQANPSITKTMLVEKIDMLSREVMAGLKNEYTYIPREVIVTQQPIVLMIDIKYTAENSYGADTIGTISRGLRPTDDGKY